MHEYDTTGIEGLFGDAPEPAVAPAPAPAPTVPAPAAPEPAPAGDLVVCLGKRVERDASRLWLKALVRQFGPLELRDAATMAVVETLERPTRKGRAPGGAPRESTAPGRMVALLDRADGIGLEELGKAMGWRSKPARSHLLRAAASQGKEVETVPGAPDRWRLVGAGEGA